MAATPAPGDQQRTAEDGPFSELGLSALGVAAYEHLSVVADWTPHTLADSTGATPEQIGAALDELVELGLIVPSQETPDLLRPVKPQVGLARLLDAREHQIRGAQDRLMRARTSTDAFISRVEEISRLRHASLEHVHGRDDISDRIAELLRESRTEVLTMLTMLPSPAALENARAGDQELLDRGVRSRVIALAGHIRRSREYLAYLQSLCEAGAEVRIASTLAARLLVIDRRVAVVPSDPQDPGREATVVFQPGLLSLTLDAFESAWQLAQPLPTGTVDPDETPAEPAAAHWSPSPLELQVIRLLGSGNKDEAIARRVGMSLRSVRRLISQISTELGSDSRFELGVLCAARGWVGGPPGAARTD